MMAPTYLLERFARLFVVVDRNRDIMTDEAATLLETALRATYLDCCDAGLDSEAETIARNHGYYDKEAS